MKDPDYVTVFQELARVNLEMRRHGATTKLLERRDALLRECPAPLNEWDAPDPMGLRASEVNCEDY